MIDPPPDQCRWFPRHSPVVTYSRRLRDLFRVRYWIRCGECSLHLGPYASRDEVNELRRELESA